MRFRNAKLTYILKILFYIKYSRNASHNGTKINPYILNKVDRHVLRFFCGKRRTNLIRGQSNFYNLAINNKNFTFPLKRLESKPISLHKFSKHRHKLCYLQKLPNILNNPVTPLVIMCIVKNNRVCVNPT
jgi:hypothetical protein